MNNSITLNEIQIEEIYKLAGEQRRTLGFVGDPAIANDIFTILDNMNILLLEYPIFKSFPNALKGKCKTE